MNFDSNNQLPNHSNNAHSQIDNLNNNRGEKGFNAMDLFYSHGFHSNHNVEENFLNNYHENVSNINSDKQKSMLTDKIKAILENLKVSHGQNKAYQAEYIKKYNELHSKQILIEKTMEKIKNLNKPKQKKHVKYLRYIPLSKIYYYSPKRNHYYYTLMDIVIKSRKKQKDNLKNLTAANNKKDINRFKFTKYEDEILKKNLLFSHEFTDWFGISKELAPRTPLQCYVRNLEIQGFYTYKKWTENEDNILKKAILYYGPKNWQQISYCLDGRNNSQCFHRWMKGINPKIKRTKWSFEEDLTLGMALKVYGNKKWSKIANHLDGRTDIQCRERFCNILDPSLEEVEWSTAEDIKLLKLYEEYGNKWSKIAKEFGNRTDNTCWRRWKYLCSANSFNSINNTKSHHDMTNSEMLMNFSENIYDDRVIYINNIQESMSIPVKTEDINNLTFTDDGKRRNHNNSNITFVDSNASKDSATKDLAVSKRKRKVNNKNDKCISNKSIFTVKKMKN